MEKFGKLFRCNFKMAILVHLVNGKVSQLALCEWVTHAFKILMTLALETARWGLRWPGSPATRNLTTLYHINVMISICAKI